MARAEECVSFAIPVKPLFECNGASAVSDIVYQIKKKFLERIALYWFDEIFDKVQFNSLQQFLFVGVGSSDNDLALGIVFTYLLYQREPIKLWHMDIGNDDIGMFSSVEPVCLYAVKGCIDMGKKELQVLCHGVQKLALIFGNEDRDIINLCVVHDTAPL